MCELVVTLNHLKSNFIIGLCQLNHLENMLREVGSASSLYRPTSVWEILIPKHLEELRTHGLNNFKLTVNNFYSQWIIIDKRHPNFKNISDLAKKYPPIESAILENTERFLDEGGGDIYLEYVCNLYRIMQARDSLGILSRLSEPLTGNPIRIRQGKRYLSQDITFAYSDFLSLAPHLGNEFVTILELGAGYGCLATLFGTLTKTRYWIVDIPPALYVAQEYIRTLFPTESIFQFRSFSNIDEVESDLAGARFAFFTPNQLELLADASIDVFVNINSFGEMTTQQVENYMMHVYRLTRQLIYLRNYDERGIATHGELQWPRPPKSIYQCRAGWNCVLNEEFDLFPPIGPPQLKTLYIKE
jgi:putative sugar O-methyltransferase